jgi:hypothetical protein
MTLSILGGIEIRMWTLYALPHSFIPFAMLNILALTPDCLNSLIKAFFLYFGIQIIGLVQKRRIFGNKDNRRPALIFMRVTV